MKFYGTSAVLNLYGETVHILEHDVFVVTYPHPVSQQGIANVREAWRAVMGDKRLIVLGDSATIDRLVPKPDAGTPIYDALIAKMQPSAL